MTGPVPEAPEATTAPPPIRGRLRRLGPTGLLALFWTGAPALAGMLLLVWIGPVAEWLESRPGALLLYVAAFTITAGLGLLPTFAQAILGGWVFGTALGIPAALGGFTGAGILGYAMARTVSRDRVQQLIQENEKARAIRDHLIGQDLGRTFLIVTLLRLPPNSPFALANLVMASTGVKPIPFVLGTLAGMLPRTALVVTLAAAASRSARDIQEFIREGPGPIVFLAGLVLLLVVVAIIGALARRALQSVNARQGRS